MRCIQLPRRRIHLSRLAAASTPARRTRDTQFERGASCVQARSTLPRNASAATEPRDGAYLASSRHNEAAATDTAGLRGLAGSKGEAVALPVLEHRPPSDRLLDRRLWKLDSASLELFVGRCEVVAVEHEVRSSAGAVGGGPLRTVRTIVAAR